MTSLKDLSREFVRNVVAALMSLMVLAIIAQQGIIWQKDKDISSLSEKMNKREKEMNERERQMGIEKLNEVREQAEIYKNRLLEIEQSLKTRTRK